MTTLTAAIYSPRWGHNDTYNFELEKHSLVVTMDARTAICTWVPNQDPVWSGESLERILRNDSIYPPSIFEDLIEHLWKSWRDGEIDTAQAQAELQEIAMWLNKITELKPNTEFWRKYF